MAGVLVRACGLLPWRLGPRLVLAVLGAALAVLPAFAQTAAVPTLRVGVYQNAPKIFVDERGEAAGILVDLLREIAARERWALKFVRCEWDACLTLLEAGEIDLMPDVACSDARARRFDFHELPALHSWGQVYRRRGQAIEAITDLDGKCIALLRGNVMEEGLRGLLASFGLSASIVPTASMDEAFEMTRTGAVDVAVVNQQFGAYRSASYELQETPIAFMPARLFYAAPRGRQRDVLARIDAVLAEWKADGASPYFAVLRRWGGHEPAPMLSARTRNLLVGLSVAGLLLAVGVVVLQRRVRLRTRALGEARRQLEATLAALPDLLFEIDREGRYHRVVALHPEQLAAPPGQLIGRTLAEVLPAPAASACMAAITEADERGDSHGRMIELATPAGPRSFELSVARGHGDDGPARFIVLSRDVTERLQAQAQAQAQAQRLSRLYATLSH